MAQDYFTPLVMVLGKGMKTDIPVKAKTFFVSNTSLLRKTGYVRRLPENWGTRVQRRLQHQY